MDWLLHGGVLPCELQFWASNTDTLRLHEVKRDICEGHQGDSYLRTETGKPRLQGAGTEEAPVNIVAQCQSRNHLIRTLLPPPLLLPFILTSLSLLLLWKMQTLDRTSSWLNVTHDCSLAVPWLFRGLVRETSGLLGIHSERQGVRSKARKYSSAPATHKGAVMFSP